MFDTAHGADPCLQSEPSSLPYPSSKRPSGKGKGTPALREARVPVVRKTQWVGRTHPPGDDFGGRKAA
jgi:hypothetical protein